MNFSEMRKLQRLIEKLRDEPRATCFELNQITSKKNINYPIFGISIGSKDPKAPTLGLFGGVHGIEKIGSHLVINHLKYITEQLKWDKQLQEFFEHYRLVSIPIVNPGGMATNSRCNPNGVDLMRNAPVECPKTNNWVAGQTYSPFFPWYRGNPLEKMELESITLCEFVKTQMFQSEFSLALDIHSGFGIKDRLWYPYSKSKEDCPDIKTIQAFKKLFRRSMAYHNYIVEQQSDSYLIYGDLWDYLYDLSLDNNHSSGTFIPWTLELGSWIWVRKNPFQALKYRGYFNPIVPHRYDRIMRRHRGLLDFFQRATVNHLNWRPQI